MIKSGAIQWAAVKTCLEVINEPPIQYWKNFSLKCKIFGNDHNLFQLVLTAIEWNSVSFEASESKQCHPWECTWFSVHTTNNLWLGDFVRITTSFLWGEQTSLDWIGQCQWWSCKNHKIIKNNPKISFSKICTNFSQKFLKWIKRQKNATDNSFLVICPYLEHWCLLPKQRSKQRKVYWFCPCFLNIDSISWNEMWRVLKFPRIWCLLQNCTSFYSTTIQQERNFEMCHEFNFILIW